MQSQTQSAPTPTPAPTSSAPTPSSPQGGRAALQGRLRAASFDEGERMLMPAENDNARAQSDSDASEPDEPDYDDQLDNTDPALHAIVLPEPVPVNLDELAAWAVASGYVWDGAARRVYDPEHWRTGLPMAEGRPPGELAETLIHLEAIGGGGASIIATTLGSAAFTRLAQGVAESYPETRNLLQRFAKLAKTTAAERAKGYDLTRKRAPDRKKAAPPGSEASMQGNPLSTEPISLQEMQSALPVPEGTCGVFHLGPDESVDISSSGFASCVGVVLMARHPNGSRSVGLAHLNTDAAERQLASFSRFVQEVSGGGAPLEVWLVGGGRGEPTSLTLARSLFEFFAQLKLTPKTSLFQSDDSHSYVVRDTPEGTTLHEAEGSTPVMEAREAELAKVDPLYGAAQLLSQQFAIAVYDLLVICNVERTHPLMRRASNEN